MRQTRRGFVGSVAAATTLAALGRSAPVLAQPSGPQRIPLSEFVKDPRRLQSLRKGVAVMKALPGSDHRSWFFQASVHAHNNALYTEAVKADSKVRRVDKARYWNKCPHGRGSSADFLIWHRAYLYYFERHLRDAAQDADLAIPYWDYSKPDQRSFPKDFAPKFTDADSKIPNSLFHSEREKAFVSGRFDLSANICEAANSLACEAFFHEPGVPGLGGDARVMVKGAQLGLLEQRPHNDIHMAVGGIVGDDDDPATQTTKGAMSDIPTAAFDPIFWVHHANIDRVWAEWSVKPGKRWGKLPEQANWFDDRPWIFLDIDGSEKQESRRFYVERANLAVHYDTDNLAAKPLAPPPIVVATTAASSEFSAKAMPDMTMPGMHAIAAQIVAQTGPLTVSPSAPVSRKFTPSDKPATTGIQSKDASQIFGHLPGTPPSDASSSEFSTHKADNGAFSLSPGKHSRVVLVLSGIDFDRAPSSGFAVYITFAGGQRALAGLIDLFAVSRKPMAGMTMTQAQSFDITKLVAKAKGTFSVSVEPYSLLVSKKGSAHTRADAVRIASMQIVVDG